MFISHAGLHKDNFAVHLRRELGLRDISAFLDERDIRAGHGAEMRMKAACQNAKLVIFVVTREFLESSHCMDELRWTLEQQEQNQQNESIRELPMILPLMYPSKTVRGYNRSELDAKRYTNAQLKHMLTAGTINVDDLHPLSSELTKLIKQHSKPMQKLQQLPGVSQASSLEQRINDLRVLASICCQRSDARARCACQKQLRAVAQNPRMQTTWLQLALLGLMNDGTRLSQAC